MGCKLVVCLVLLILISQMALANGVSVALKRTNPGIVNVRPAELIFDIVNTDIDYEVEGFIVCQSPDDVTVSSNLGMGSGSGAHYVSPLFVMDKAPSQKAAYFTVEAYSAGDYRTNCVFKYIFFRNDEGGRVYLKMNLEEVDAVKDSDYREIRLDKNIPFVMPTSEYMNAYCPSGRGECRADDVIQINVPGGDKYLVPTIVLLFVSVALVFYMIRSRK
jgi:hypothetical protein